MISSNDERSAIYRGVSQCTPLPCYVMSHKQKQPKNQLYEIQYENGQPFFCIVLQLNVEEREDKTALKALLIFFKSALFFQLNSKKNNKAKPSQKKMKLPYLN